MKIGDEYLNEFINYCKINFKNNLMAIVIYGSYTYGYFDKKKSDYDVFVIFKNKIPMEKNYLAKKFKKVSLQYFCTSDQLIEKIRHGYWTIYITLLKGSKVLYFSKDYSLFLKQISHINFLEEIFDIIGMEYIERKRMKILNNLKGFKAAKWCLAEIRKRLQLLTYIRKCKLIWDFNKTVSINKDLFDKKEKQFLNALYKKVMLRKTDFSDYEKEFTLKLVKKLDEELIIKELLD
ncbi:nucleotidyltransferase domain-containing protein [Candidatus Woesearchaeota archaeon]|nr:nucleotidyltransferase domain-containing protein [Candidatus Woesearchaeota archaeon]